MALSLLLPVVLPGWTVTQTEILLEGYQMYAIGIERRSLVPTLIVHTGDAAHKITVSALSPPSRTEWDTMMSLLKRHAKPKETPYGTLLVTSLAQFRSDYTTIVQIPGGNLESAKQQLYTNINLLRMGCSGRSGLTLEEPSDTTKNRFLSTYFLPDNHPSGTGKAPILFNDTVLELVKLVQVSLHIFGYYSPTSFDGLLCDSTVEGLRRWVNEVGEQLVNGLGPMERTADPNTVASLLSLVLAIRNRLVGLSGSTAIIPKDPFLHPRLFTRALATYVSTGNPGSNSVLSSQPSKGSSYASHSPRQSISHPSHGGSPHIPTSSIPAFLKDQLNHLAHGNAEATSYTSSLPTVPTLSSPVSSSPSSATSPTQTLSAPNSTRLPHTAISLNTLGGTSTPALALTIPTPTTSAFHTPASISLANSNYSTLNASPVNGDQAVFPSTDNTTTETVFLARPLIETIFSAYDNKLLKTSPEVRRAVRKEQKANKKSISFPREDEGKEGLSSIAGLASVAPHLLPGGSLPLTSGLKTGLTGGLTSTLANSLTGGNTHTGAAGILMPMTDLEEFIEMIVGEISSFRRRRKEDKEEKKERDKVKVKVKEERKEREKREREREKKEGDYLSESSSSEGLDLSKAAKKVKAKVKGRSVDKLRDSKDNEREVPETKEYAKDKKQGKDSVDGVGGLVLGLWTGRVNLVVRLRERTEEKERERERERAVQLSDAHYPDMDGGSRRSHQSKLSKVRPPLWSDGDTDSHSYTYDGTSAGKRVSLPAREKFPRRASVTGTGSRGRYGSVQSIPLGDKSDERSTEDEGPNALGTESFGALWAKSGSKVRGKLESWAGLSKNDSKLTKPRNKAHSSRNSVSTGLIPPAETNVVDLSPTPSPLGSPSISHVGQGDPPSPIQLLTSPSSSPATKRTAGKQMAPSLGAISPSPSQIHLYPQPQSPVWNPDDDDDLLSSGQVSPVGYGSGFGFDSGTEDPRTPKAWPNHYFTGQTTKLGSPFGSRISVGASSTGRNGDGLPHKRGSEATYSSTSSSHFQDDGVFKFTEAFTSLGKGHPSKRPWPANRIPHASRVSSWSDPVSARDDAQGVNSHMRNGSDASITDDSEDRLSKDEETRYMYDSRPHHVRSSTVRPAPNGDTGDQAQRSSSSNRDPTEILRQNRPTSRQRETYSKASRSKSHHWEDNIAEEELSTTRKMLGLVPRRRRSFHSLSMYRPDISKLDEETVTDTLVDRRTVIKVLPIDRMRIDVELCGYYLIMWRRTAHLLNVIATLQIITFRLSETNANMREHYDAHLPDIAELESHLKSIAEVDLESANTLKISQATKTLWYEAEQFFVPDLWHIASPPRQKVLAMREKIFGASRRLPEGVHGAHGRFNRLQWTLDGRERLVDAEGKTESEVAEERGIDAEGAFISPPTEDVEDVVEHSNIKPMWLLRFFTSWGANWGATKGKDVKAEPSASVSGLVSEEIPARVSEPIKIEKAASL
ncbi:hypothetical protein BDP27DRAFT_1314518 [Rhodocollybia butyracea]|uniref:STB6-like N-terminal domain-containing protein n=1 Tax=Rhodocollybia butyracea TaxID=206335 RepID=A0A9P5Q0D2_9AGAR|nr:hypothetical protein BDP27DRAFT_1314518 [Rhodocollybia butyracea]